MSRRVKRCSEKQLAYVFMEIVGEQSGVSYAETNPPYEESDTGTEAAL